jgi:hypothetical protein
LTHLLELLFSSELLEELFDEDVELLFLLAFDEEDADEDLCDEDLAGAADDLDSPEDLDAELLWTGALDDLASLVLTCEDEDLLTELLPEFDSLLTDVFRGLSADLVVVLGALVASLVVWLPELLFTDVFPAERREVDTELSDDRVPVLVDEASDLLPELAAPLSTVPCEALRLPVVVRFELRSERVEAYNLSPSLLDSGLE